MINRLLTWPFFFLSIFCLSFIQIAFIRKLLNITDQIEVDYLYTLILAIAGIMSALTAMILSAKRLYIKKTGSPKLCAHYWQAHALGLLLYIPLPLANFFALYWLCSYKERDTGFDECIKALNFQISIYLYLLLALFLCFIAFGLLLIPIILLFHFFATIIAIFYAAFNKDFKYWGSIPICQGR